MKGREEGRREGGKEGERNKKEDINSNIAKRRN